MTSVTPGLCMRICQDRLMPQPASGGLHAFLKMRLRSGASAVRCLFEEHIDALIGVLWREDVAQAVKVPQFRRVLHPMFRHVADHLATGHFAEGSLFHHLAALQLPEHADDPADADRQVPGHALAVFPGGQVHDGVRLLGQRRRQGIPPELI